MKINEINIKIKELRHKANISQTELARRAGVTSAAISLLEKRKRYPSLIMIRRIAEALNTTPECILGEIPIIETLDIQNFFVEYGQIKKLKQSDQRLIKILVMRLLKADDIISPK